MQPMKASSGWSRAPGAGASTPPAGTFQPMCKSPWFTSSRPTSMKSLPRRPPGFWTRFYEAPTHAPPRGKHGPTALEFLVAAAKRLGRQDAELIHRRGRAEREVIAVLAQDVDLLVVARDGDRSRLGPHSLGHATRFVVDHAPCSVLLVWPDEPPGLESMPPPPPG